MSISREQEQHEARSEQYEWVNTGEPPIVGLKEKGHPERKKQCEDVKINDPEKGLFLVADGISTASGWFAASETAKIVQKLVGEHLDREVENIAGNSSLDTERKAELVDALVRAQIVTAFQEANRDINMKAALDPRIAKAGTTASLAKLVKMPNGRQRLFIANAGDSRLYLIRGGKLHRLSQDDSFLSFAERNGQLTPERAHAIDQASSTDSLAPGDQEFFKRRNMVFRAVGGHEDQSYEADAVDVSVGDRLLIASDGVTDQLLETQLVQLLNASSDDRAAERAVQQSAEKMSLDGTAFRSKGDDIAAIVRTIEADGPDRAYVQPKPAVSRADITPAHVKAWRTEIPKLEQQIQEAKRRGESTRDAEQELARHEYWVAREDLRALGERLPPRFHNGDEVRVMREDVQPSTPYFARWKVKAFDAEQNAYLVAHPSGKEHRFFERFQLEMWQDGELARPGDRFERVSPVSQERVWFTSVGREDGKVILIHERPEGIERQLEAEAVVEQAVAQDIRRGRMLQKQMAQAQSVLLDKNS